MEVWPMKRMWWTGLVMAALVGTRSAAQKPQAAETLLQTAIKKEVVDGDLNAAIQQYKAIVSKFAKERALVAGALVHMAECYQKLGDSQSRKIYEQIVRDYGDQKEAVATARAHLDPGNASVSSQRVWTVANAKGAPTKFDF